MHCTIQIYFHSTIIKTNLVIAACPIKQIYDHCYQNSYFDQKVKNQK